MYVCDHSTIFLSICLSICHWHLSYNRQWSTLNVNLFSCKAYIHSKFIKISLELASVFICIKLIPTLLREPLEVLYQYDKYIHMQKMFKVVLVWSTWNWTNCIDLCYFIWPTCRDLKYIWIFLCRLGSIAAHRDHFVRHLSVCLCLSCRHIFLVVMHSYICLQVTGVLPGMLPLCLWQVFFLSKNNIRVLVLFKKFWLSLIFHYFEHTTWIFMLSMFCCMYFFERLQKNLRENLKILKILWCR